MKPNDNDLYLVRIPAGIVVGQLVDGDYDVVERVAPGYPAARLRSLVGELGAPLVDVPAEEWARMSAVYMPDGDVDAYESSVALWTTRGRSDVAVRLRFQVTPWDTIDVAVLGFGPVDEPPDGFPVPPAPSRGEPDLGDRAIAEEDRIPERWRPMLLAVIDRLVGKDYAGIAADGLLYHPTDPGDDSIGEWIEKYPATLVPFPDEAWQFSEHAPVVNQDDTWWVTVDLWTAEEGHSDLTLEAIVYDDGVSEPTVKIDNVHVM